MFPKTGLEGDPSWVRNGLTAPSFFLKTSTCNIRPLRLMPTIRPQIVWQDVEATSVKEPTGLPPSFTIQLPGRCLADETHPEAIGSSPSYAELASVTSGEELCLWVTVLVTVLVEPPQ